MPQIEELHTTTKTAAPGWSYVVDTGYDPSKVAINPTNRKRQRTAAQEGTSAGDLTLRQQTAITRHLAELDKDNHKDVAILIPKSRLDGGGGGTRRQTTNVRRILQSGKDFAYYIEEEEALLAQRGGASTTALIPAAAVTTTTTASTTVLDGGKTTKPAQRASKTPIARRKSALAVSAESNESSPAPNPSSSSTPLTAARIPPPPQTQTVPLSYGTPPPIVPDSLLHPSPVPGISASEIETLLSAPALSYTASRSQAPTPSTAPPKRVFCEICGYWGRVRCMKCGARVCGLACKGMHDESRCLKFYA